MAIEFFPFYTNASAESSKPCINKMTGLGLVKSVPVLKTLKTFRRYPSVVVATSLDTLYPPISATYYLKTLFSLAIA